MTGPRFRRTQHLFFYGVDGQVPDVTKLLAGIVQLSPVRCILAISTVGEEALPVSEQELVGILRIPTTGWSLREKVLEEGTLAEDRLHRFTRHGILICDDPAEPYSALRSRDAAISSAPWNAVAALYHSIRKWRDVRLDVLEKEGRLETLQDLRNYGPPPPHFHSVPGVRRHSLALAHREGQMYETLTRRRTIRTLNRTELMSVEHLSVLLQYVFGCRAYGEVSEDIWLLSRTSPSGGALHPIEVYPLLRRVEGFEPGLYHYNVEHHALTAMRPMSEEEVAETAVLFAAGQEYASNAQALFIMTARFSRSFWKYRRHEKAYSVVLMDAGHLSQTFYLVCTELGLGPFVTAAINDRNIEEMLGIDGFEEGAIAVLGVGQPAPRDDGLDPVFKPYAPPASSS